MHRQWKPHLKSQSLNSLEELGDHKQQTDTMTQLLNGDQTSEQVKPISSENEFKGLTIEVLV